MSALRHAGVCALAALISACGGAPVVDDGGAGAAVVDDRPASGPARGRPLLAEAWPEPMVGHVERLHDGRVGGDDFVLGADTPLPVTLVFRVVDGPLEIAAVALGTSADARSARDVAIATYLGDVPVDRDTFHRFVQNATPAGVARLDATGGETVLRFAAPVMAHWVFVRIDATHGGDGVSLSEVSAFESDELLDLAESADAVRWVDLSNEALAPIARDDAASAHDGHGDHGAAASDVVDVFESVDSGTGEDAP